MKCGDILYRDQVIVLMYHHLDTTMKNQATIKPELFDQQLTYLTRCKFNFITMDDFVKYKKGDGNVPANAILITFDDGYESFYTYGFPIMQRHAIKASNFLILKYYDPNIKVENHAPKKLTLTQINKMSKQEFDFYNHTYDLHKTKKINEQGLKGPILNYKIYLDSAGRRETDAEYLNRIEEDFIKANRVMDLHFSDSKQLLAFPFGSYNLDAVTIGKKQGIEYFFTTRKGINSREGNIIFRVNAGNPKISPKILLQKIIKVSID
jgi:peptidoglycan/xylan/chitin deacetylase (PgdA/CDA1 family)